jgi:hypothetical protein
MIRATASARKPAGGASPPSAPTVVDITDYQDPGSYTSADVDAPTGLADGDVVVIFASRDDDAGTLTGPAGFTELASASTDSSRDLRLAVWRKVIADASSEPAAYTVTSSELQEFSIHAVAVRGVDNATPEDTTAATSTPATGSASLPSPEVTTVTDGALVLRYCAATTNTSSADQSLTAPGATSTVQPLVGSPGDMVAGVQHFALATAGASGVDAWTRAHTDGPAILATVALRPA